MRPEGTMVSIAQGKRKRHPGFIMSEVGYALKVQKYNKLTTERFERIIASAYPIFYLNKGSALVLIEASDWS